MPGLTRSLDLQLELRSDQSARNERFQSWRLANGLVGRKYDFPLPGVTLEFTSSHALVLGFLHARARVLHNHLIDSGGRLFVFVAEEGRDKPSLLEVQVHAVPPDSSAAQPMPAAVCRIADLDVPSINLPLATGEAAAQPSMAVVSPADSATHTSCGITLVASLGLGDLQIIQRDVAGAVSTSCVIHPLRPTPPLHGVRAFTIASAVSLGEGVIRCIVWAIAAAAGSACCEVFTLDLKLDSAADVAAAVQGRPAVKCILVTLLKRCKQPPYCVLPAPTSSGSDAFGGVLLGLEPADDQEDVIHVCCHGAGGGGSGAAAMQQDDDDDLDPRTLAAAAARLAAYTSDQPAPSLVDQRWADVYKESGPDGLGALGDEPACELFVMGQAAPSSGAAGAAAESSSQDVRVPPYQVAQRWHMSCGSNKVLTTTTASASTSAGATVLLGLTDDVDCAVVSVTWPNGSATPEVKHLHNVPALAYVAAGKLQRKHLLLGPAGGGLAAVLVEGQKFYYVYRATGASDEYGQQEVVDMELRQDEAILGARLWAGAEAGQHLLLLLTQRRVLLHTLCL